MEEYQFEYSRLYETILVMLLCVALFLILLFVGIYMSLPVPVIVLIDFGLTYLLFRALKRKVTHDCLAKLDNMSVDFQFEKDSKLINFNDLVSFKVYYGKNGPILYLKTNTGDFKIFANNNFCDTSRFRIFCEAIMVQLEKYKNKSNTGLIREGSIFATKKMLYFLVIGTLVYLLAFFIETRILRIAIGIGGGIYFGILWIRYSSESRNKIDQDDN